MAPGDGPDDGRRGFDFLLGSWRIDHRRLRRRLEGCDEWDEFASSAEVVPVLGGLGIVDTYSAQHSPFGAFDALTLRLYDPATGTWTTWWASSTAPGRLDPPVSGTARNGSARLFGEDVHEGRAVAVRFEYRRSVDGAAVLWEQAFSEDAGATWEVNWTMDWRRIASAPTGGRAWTL